MDKKDTDNLYEFNDNFDPDRILKQCKNIPSKQEIEEGKKKLAEFLESNQTKQ
jgi:hypothetical protein